MANAFGYCEVCGDGLAAVSRFCGACEAVYRQAEHDALIIERLKAEVERLRSALGHYADADNWGIGA